MSDMMMYLLSIGVMVSYGVYFVRVMDRRVSSLESQLLQIQKTLIDSNIAKDNSAAEFRAGISAQVRALSEQISKLQELVIQKNN